LTPAGGGGGSDQASRQLHGAMYDMQRTLTALADRLEQVNGASAQAAAGTNDESVRELAKGVDQLVRQMRAEQKVVREWVDEQAVRQSEVATVLKDLASNISRRSV
jgi:hypothetical protein